MVFIEFLQLCANAMRIRQNTPSFPDIPLCKRQKLACEAKTI